MKSLYIYKVKNPKPVNRMAGRPDPASGFEKVKIDL
jgi:hypothetical protein